MEVIEVMVVTKVMEVMEMIEVIEMMEVMEVIKKRVPPDVETLWRIMHRNLKLFSFSKLHGG